MRIVENKAKCARCGDVIYSHWPWDYVVCFCGAISVRGGTEKLVRGYADKHDVIELSTYSYSPDMDAYRAGRINSILGMREETIKSE